MGSDRRQDVPRLAELDSLGDTEQLRAAARAALPPGGGDPTPPPTQEGTDPTGTIVVRVDARGRVEDVRADRWWRSHLDPASFGAAVLKAHRAARQLAAEALALASLAAKEQGADPFAGAGGAQVLTTPTDPEEWLTWVRQRREDACKQRVRVARLWSGEAFAARRHSRTPRVSPRDHPRVRSSRGSGAARRTPGSAPRRSSSAT